MYRCMATNEIGSLSHSAKINVIGPPFVRIMKDIAAVEGDVLHVRCPVAGYPVEEVYWEKSKYFKCKFIKKILIRNLNCLGGVASRDISFGPHGFGQVRNNYITMFS
ncbi:hypothetical protein AVEN_202762-1 [Araneus ventricosus]|uniref:Ig-like domain-containing protein n=1 Tax=Araneus ventricosus TaxID=182803 RepID=A0A4Y2V9T0_ARAVE|nr:hypothetical protein AVEN_202762-1 [Araneus ventricosus]